MITIYPEFIAPLFDKYTLLPESPLKNKIEALASRLNYPLTKLFVVQGFLIFILKIYNIIFNVYVFKIFRFKTFYP